MAKHAQHARVKGVSTLAAILIALAAAAAGAAVTFFICNERAARMRARLEARRVVLLKYARDMTLGEKIEPKDLAADNIQKDDATALGNVVGSDCQKFVVGRRLGRAVHRGQWVQWNHTPPDCEYPVRPIGAGMVAVSLDLDPRASPGRLCAPGDRVNILAEIQIAEGAPPRVFRILRNVKVLATGSSAETRPDAKGGPGTDRPYRSVVIEVSPKVSLQLHRLLNLAKEGVRLEVLPPDGPFDPSKHGIINPDEPILRELCQPKPKAPIRAQVQLLKFARGMAAGEKIDPKDLEAVSIRKDVAAALGNVVAHERRDAIIGRRLRQGVVRGQWVLRAHVAGEPGMAAKRIADGMVAVTVALDPRSSPGPLCRPGDRVNILAQLQVAKGARPRAFRIRIFRIIRNVKVLSTGSTPATGPAAKPEAGADRPYRSITVEVSPEVSPQLRRLLKLAAGRAWIEVLMPGTPLDPKRDGIINPAEPILKQLAEPAGRPPTSASAPARP